MKQRYKGVLHGLLVLLCACHSQKKEPDKLQQTVINYLYHPSLISDTFSRMVYGLPLDCRGLDDEKQLLYFIFRKEVGRSNGLKAITLDTNKVEFAHCDKGDCEFGGLRGNITGYYALRFPVTNLRVPKNVRIPCRLTSMKYEVSLKDIANCLNPSTYYNTEEHFQLSSDFQPGSNLYASNIGAYISKKGKDPIIQPLSNKLTEGLKTKEEKIQALLHFVTNEITYSYEDYWYESEITKRAHEVLISGLADCSGKSTLLASLLEAQDLPYALLYFNHHINVGVPGSFPEENHLWITLGSKKYFFAETTYPNFQIGRTHLADEDLLNKVYYYQKPQKRKYIYSVANDQPLRLISEKEIQNMLDK